jgi:hypothetical protein
VIPGEMTGVALVAIAAFGLNVPLGRWRERRRKFSVTWWLLVHASIPPVVLLRVWLDTPLYFIPLFIAAAVAGQLAGARSRRPRA